MKKKILSIMLTLSMLAMFMPCIASAETYGDFEYERNGSGITITEYDGNGGDIEIPAEIDGLPVTKIGVHAFYQARVKNVTIPNSVTTIEHDAFSCCDDLISVTIPNGVTTIGKQAFLGCEALTNITIPGSVINIDGYTFAGCYSLESATILDGVTNISECMFNGCRNLKSVTIAGSVTSIGTFAFNTCVSLENVTISNGVKTIGNGAFRTCPSLTNITLPDSVTNIDKEAFAFCDSLTDITIPDSVTSIGEGAFGGCNSLTSITIPSSVTSIGKNGSVDTFPDTTNINYEGTEEQWRQIYPNDNTVVPDNDMPTEQTTPAQPTAAPTEAPAPQPTTAPHTNSFTDVPETHWAYDNIMRITELGGFNGYPDGTFKPDNQIMHEEFLKVVMSLAYKGDVNAAPVSALSDGWADWAKPMLNAAVDAGIVTAEDTDLLATGTPITRAEMAKIISRTLDYLGKVKAATPDTSKITDWNYIAEVYKPYIADAYSKGIITGYIDGSFGPANHLTRAEASAVIVRMIDAQ